MRSTSLIAALAALLLAPVTAKAQPAPAVVDAGPITIGTSYRLTSKILGDDREINVWLPTGYDKSQDRYPVVYLLDGARDQDFIHVAGLGQLASLSWTFGPVIVVGIQTRERRAELTARPTDRRYLTAFPESGGAGRFRDFLRREVIPFVDGKFRTGPRRALIGESLAGLFVVDTLLTEPTLFQDYVAISPSLWWDDRRPLKRLDATATSRLAEGTRLYLAVADEGGTMQDGVDRLLAHFAEVPTTTLSLHYVDFSRAATHATVHHRAVEDALRWLYPMPPDPAAETPWFMIEGAAPPAAKKAKP